MDRVCSSRCGILVNRVHTTFMDCCPSDVVYVFYTSNLSLISKLSAGADVCQSQVTSELNGGMYRWMRMPGKSGGVAIWWRCGPGSLVQLARRD